jgi:hypothetical protein
MRSSGLLFGIVAGLCVAAIAPAEPPGVMAAPMPTPATTAPGRIVLSDVVEARHREAVVAVAKKPTLSTRGAVPDFVCTPAVFEWLLEHPDRVSLAWQRLKVPCVEIIDSGNGKFTWNDGEGSELAWQTVGRFANGLVWYATGKVKPSPITPTVPVKAVVVMLYPKKLAEDGTATFSPVAHVYLQTDSKAASVVLRLLGPTAPKLAEQGAEQLLFFFSGIAKYVQKHPEKYDELLAPSKK